MNTRSFLFKKDGRVLCADVQGDVPADFPPYSILSGFGDLADAAANGFLDVRIGSVISVARFQSRGRGESIQIPDLPPGAMRRFGLDGQTDYLSGTEVCWAEVEDEYIGYDMKTFEQIAKVAQLGELSISETGRTVAQWCDGRVYVSSGTDGYDFKATVQDWYPELRVDDRFYVALCDSSEVRLFAREKLIHTEAYLFDPFFYNGRIIGSGEDCIVDIELSSVTRTEHKLIGTPVVETNGKMAAIEEGRIISSTGQTTLRLFDSGLVKAVEQGWKTESRLWNRDGIPTHDIDFPNHIQLRGNLLMSATYNEVLVRNWETTEVICRGRFPDPPDVIRLSRNGKKLATICKNKISVVSFESGERFETKGLGAKDARWNCEGGLETLHNDGTIRTWRDVGDGVVENPEILQIGEKKGCRFVREANAITILTDKKVIHLTADGTLVWSSDLKTREKRLALSSDRVMVQDKHGVHLLDKKNGVLVATVADNARDFATDGERFAISRYSGVTIFDRHGERVAWLQQDRDGVVSWDEGVLATTGRSTLIWDIAKVDAFGGHPIDEWVIAI